MREILFKGKRTDNKQWVEGFYALIGELNPNAYIITDNGNMIRVAHKSISEFTGLTDKNGKKIFEGDILDCVDRVVFVKWHSYCGTWDSMFIKYSGERCSNGITPAEWKYRAVIIGNIHDNPELLKGGEQE